MNDNLTENFDNMQESRIRDYLALLKPRVMTLVVFTGLCGILIAPGNVHPFIALVSVLLIAIGSGAAGCINMWYDRDIDSIMERTKKRPIPMGLIHPQNALEFGVILSFMSVMIMAFLVNITASLLLLSAILFYVFIYTIWLKRLTPQNIVIGGAAGAFPPMIGYAVVNANINLESLILFLIIFMWTPPHFWALSLYKNQEYQKANIPMLPVTDGIDVTKKHILGYTILLFLTCLLPVIFGFSGLIYLCTSIILNLIFLNYAIKIYLAKDIKLAPKLFGYSISYLFMLFSFLVIDKYFFFNI